MPHALPSLPYPYGALEPTIDELTMRLHHDKHHAGYVAGLNAALEGSACTDRPVEDMLGDLQAWWNVVDWQPVAARCVTATSRTPGRGRSRDGRGDRE